MKKLYYLLILFSLTAFPQGVWKSIESPTDKTLRTIVFLDTLTGWIAGDSSFIFFTTDGGESWTQQYENEEYNIYDIFFIDEYTGWAVASPEDPVASLNALFLNTSDGGESWNEIIYPAEHIYFNSIHYFNQEKGFIGGIQGNIIYTTNAGERWHIASIDSGFYSHFDIYKLKFYNEDYGVATGGHFDIVGMAWISRDGGLNWVPQPVAPDIVIDFHFYDSLHIIGVTKEIESFGSGFIRTRDGGETWEEYQNFPYFGPAESMALRTPEEIWVTLSTSQTFIYSLDSGHTWTDYPAPDSSSILALLFIDSLHGFGIGEFGAIIKYSYDSTSSAGDNISSYNYNLYQNYPNPFNPESVIRYELAQAGPVKLIIYDLLGNEIETLINKEMPAGRHTITFNALKNNLSSGIYFYRLNTGNYSAVRKMLYLK